MVSQSLGWYIGELIYSNGIIGFLQDNLTGSDLRNETISFIIGIGLGLSMPILLLSSAEFDAPMDYKEQIVRFSNKEQCERIVKDWFEGNREILNQEDSNSD